MGINQDIAKEWWAKRRLRYNIGLMIVWISAFILYLIIIGVHPHELSSNSDIDGGVNIVLQVPAYIVIVIIANFCYNLGYYVDSKYNTNNNDSFRRKWYNRGFWFSVGLPFLLPLFLIIKWLF